MNDMEWLGVDVQGSAMAAKVYAENKPPTAAEPEFRLGSIVEVLWDGMWVRATYLGWNPASAVAPHKVKIHDREWYGPAFRFDNEIRAVTLQQDESSQQFKVGDEVEWVDRDDVHHGVVQRLIQHITGKWLEVRGTSEMVLGRVGSLPVTEFRHRQKQQWKTASLRERFPHTCPRCGRPAYVGFTATECSGGCK